MHGDELTRSTIRLALVLACAGGVMMPWLDGVGWRATTTFGRVVRACWVLGFLCYLAHVALAFHYFHHWSHAEAVRHVEERSGFGPGIAFSHLFTLAWGADVLWWCVNSARYSQRSPWIGGVLFSFMFFMAFNATVVYETGYVRLAGVAGSVALATSVGLRWYSRRSSGVRK